MIRRHTHWILTVGLALAAAGPAQGEEKDASKEPPQVLLALPLAVAPGKETKLTLRGLKLENATAVRVTGLGAPLEVPIASKGSAAVPNKQEAKTVGNTQVETTLTLPEAVPAGEVSVVVVAPDGESVPYALRVEPADRLTDEQEPNESFDRAQETAVGRTVRGTVQNPRDVDVYRFAGTAGQSVQIEIHAARRGSALDPILMLFDDRGQLLATADDGDGTRDAALRVPLPRDGVYRLTVLDAHDEGSAAHPYLLSVQAAESSPGGE